jgi:hypothetical protein
MKFAWDTPLTDLTGAPINDERGTLVLLGGLVVQSLMIQDKKDLDGAAKFARFRLATLVAENKDIDVTDAALIKEVCGNVLTPLPVGRIWELLEHPLG